MIFHYANIEKTKMPKKKSIILTRKQLLIFTFTVIYTPIWVEALPRLTFEEDYIGALKVLGF